LYIEAILRHRRSQGRGQRRARPLPNF